VQSFTISFMSDIWQEYDCPISGIDFDLCPPVYEGDSFHCSGCWGSHIATPDLVQQYERTPEGVRVVALQKRPV
jgi:hypothetical protein